VITQLLAGATAVRVDPEIVQSVELEEYEYAPVPEPPDALRVAVPPLDRLVLSMATVTALACAARV
jgi:hypothetical protein